MDMVHEEMQGADAKELRDCWTGLTPPGGTSGCNLDPNLEGISLIPDDHYAKYDIMDGFGRDVYSEIRKLIQICRTQREEYNESRR